MKFSQAAFQKSQIWIPITSVLKCLPHYIFWSLRLVNVIGETWKLIGILFYNLYLLIIFQVYFIFILVRSLMSFFLLDCWYFSDWFFKDTYFDIQLSLKYLFLPIILVLPIFTKVPAAQEVSLTLLSENYQEDGQTPIYLSETQAPGVLFIVCNVMSCADRCLCKNITWLLICALPLDTVTQISLNSVL